MEKEINDIKCLEIKVFGRVQGVYFRYFAKKSADKLGIKGYCKNLEDGTVFISSCGKKDMMEEFLKNLRKGPLFARVDNIEVKEVEKFSSEDFKIL